MTLGSFTRASLEADAADRIKTIIASFSYLEELRRRCATELAAGTLDGTAFYQGDANDKANVLGALDDMHAVFQAMQGVALPTLNYRRYIDFLVGT